jgi:hypothetical protein
MFSRVNPFWRVNRRDEASAKEIDDTQKMADEIRLHAKAQTEQLLKTLREFREKREALRHDVE